jgi:hypothetical protein
MLDCEDSPGPAGYIKSPLEFPRSCTVSEVEDPPDAQLLEPLLQDKKTHVGAVDAPFRRRRTKEFLGKAFYLLHLHLFIHF